MKKLNNKEANRICGGLCCCCIEPNGNEFLNGMIVDNAECKDACNDYGLDGHVAERCIKANKAGNEVEYI